jgi:hypothetical protein
MDERLQLTDRSRRPYRYANQLPFQVENYILNMKREHPSWVLAKSGSACFAGSREFLCRPKAPSMRFWTAPRPFAASRSGNRFIVGPAAQ